MATVPTAYTWTVGELMTASKLNSYLRDAVGFLLARPYATLTHTLAQSIPDSTNTALSFNTEVADTDNGHSTTSTISRYVVQTAGIWTVTGSVPWNLNAVGKRECFVRTNGAFEFSSSAIVVGANVRCSLSVTDKVACSVGDYIEIVGWHNGGAGITIDPTFHGGQRFHLIWERT